MKDEFPILFVNLYEIGSNFELKLKKFQNTKFDFLIIRLDLDEKKLNKALGFQYIKHNKFGQQYEHFTGIWNNIYNFFFGSSFDSLKDTFSLSDLSFKIKIDPKSKLQEFINSNNFSEESLKKFITSNENIELEGSIAEESMWLVVQNNKKRNQVFYGLIVGNSIFVASGIVGTVFGVLKSKKKKIL